MARTRTTPARTAGPSKPQNYMDKIFTLTGMTLAEALLKMQETLEPEAYKAVPGGADLTDISPAYLTEVATICFGACGVGWWYAYDEKDLHIAKETRQTKSGNVYETYVAEIHKFSLSIRLLDEKGQFTQTAPIIANGSNVNTEPGWAIRGALTSCIGAAFSKLLWQLDVYKGKVTHHNVRQLPPKATGRKEPQAGATGTIPTEKPRVDNQWEQRVLDKVIALQLVQSRPHAVNILNLSPLKAIPYGKLDPPVAIAYFIGWGFVKDAAPEESSEARAIRVNKMWEAPETRNDWLDKALELMGDEPPEPAESVGY